jgi:hypothetical protein
VGHAVDVGVQGVVGEFEQGEICFGQFIVCGAGE